MACAICKIRREKRRCPGVGGEICAICCGEQREETVACPMDCEYLQIAHAHEAQERKDPAGVPNSDVRVTREFLEKNIMVVAALQHSLLVAAVEANAIDNDVKEALAGLVRTYRTLDSGLYYESRPANPMAAAVFDAIQLRISELRQTEDERGVHKLLDNQIRSILIFIQQMEYALNNGRKRGRAFIDSLRGAMGEFLEQQQPKAGTLIVS